VEKTKESFDDMTELLRQELGKFEKDKLEGFQQSLTQFVKSAIETQKKLIASWEEFLPEVQAL